jgi:LuxR family maltose regulon positive regulatory protein
MTLVRVLIAQEKRGLVDGSIHDAKGLLERLLQAAEEGRRMGSVIEISALLALAHAAQGDIPLALASLERALTLAEPEGYLRVFIEEGKPMQELLLAYVHASFGEHITYAQKLLVAFVVPGPSVAYDVRSTNLVEQLTAREIEVLQAMAEGFSNHEIAEKFILAEGTVKFYVHAVLEKLGVHNRAKAVIEAKKLKII